MSTRERWVVYPLLFFAILSGLKNQFALPTDGLYESITCKKLIVQSLDGRSLVELTSSTELASEQAGRLVLYGPREKVDAKTAESANGEPSQKNVKTMGGLTPQPLVRTVELGSETGGGFLKCFGQAATPTIKVGHASGSRQSGVVAEDRHGKTLLIDDATNWGIQIDWPADASE